MYQDRLTWTARGPSDRDLRRLWTALRGYASALSPSRSDGLLLSACAVRLWRLLRGV